MAERSQTFEAIILHTRESPSGGRFVSCLTKERGLVDCFLFGGGRSKLRSMTVPWHSGIMLLYADAKNNLQKITDFEPVRLHAALRANYEAIIIATWASELMLATHGLGGSGYSVMEEMLDALETLAGADAAALRTVRLLFAAKVLDVAGALPELSNCQHCTGKIPQNRLQYYSPRKSGFVCESCKDDDDEGIPGGALSWLYGNLDRPIAKALPWYSSGSEMEALECCCMDMLARMAGRSMRTDALLGR